MTRHFDETAVARDLEQIPIIEVAQRHGMSCRTLYRNIGKSEMLRRAVGRFHDSLQPKDRAGQQFGWWKLSRFSRWETEGRTKPARRAIWWATCLGCGTEREVRIGNLQRGNSSRCASCAAKAREAMKRLGASV